MILFKIHVFHRVCWKCSLRSVKNNILQRGFTCLSQAESSRDTLRKCIRDFNLIVNGFHMIYFYFKTQRTDTEWLLQYLCAFRNVAQTYRVIGKLLASSLSDELIITRRSGPLRFGQVMSWVEDSGELSICFQITSMCL